MSRQRQVLWIVIGLAMGLLGGFSYLSMSSGPSLDSQALAQARQIWEAEGPDSYVMELEMRGRLNEIRRVEVRDGIAVDLQVGGVAASRSSWDHWTVDGLFNALERELGNAARPHETYGIDDSAQIDLAVEFEPDLGYPTYFRRHLEGYARDMEWRVVRFEAL